MSEATALKDLREAIARAQRAEARVARLEEALREAERERDDEIDERWKYEDRIRELETRVQELEAALTACGDYAFGNWDSDAERWEAGTHAEELVRRALDTKEGPPENPSFRLDKKGRLVDTKEGA